MFLMNCFGIEMVLCNLYLERFDSTKGLLFDTFVKPIQCVLEVSGWCERGGVQRWRYINIKTNGRVVANGHRWSI